MSKLASEQKEQPSPLWQRLLWFVGIWLASITCLTIVAYAIRFWLGLG